MPYPVALNERIRQSGSGSEMMCIVAADDFDPNYESLLTNLDAAIAILRRYGRTHWANWLETDRSRIAEGDGYGLDHLLQAFGGMGSFNDVLFHSVNGDPSEDSAVAAVNRDFVALRSAIWSAVRQLKRDLDRPLLADPVCHTSVPGRTPRS